MKNSQNSFLKKLKEFCSNSVLTIAALLLVNVAMQFLIYPYWARKFSPEDYGHIIYIMSIVNTFAVAIGCAANYARMTESTKGNQQNGDYNVLLAILSIPVILIVSGAARMSGMGMSLAECFLVGILAVLTMLRYYGDVQYRLTLDFKGYFIYYLVITIGYGIGVVLFKFTGIWALALLPGELFGLLWIIFRGYLYRENCFVRSASWRMVWHTTVLLIITEIMANAIFNGDRILLEFVLGGAAVSTYYMASLVGKTLSLVTTPLNSVIIGYLVRYQGRITRKMYWMFALATVGMIVLATAGTLLGSYILIPILYPDAFDTVKAFFLIANLTQVIYFTTNVVTTVLLRFDDPKVQLYINLTYASTFLLFCIPAAMYFGIQGFCVALLAATLVRYLTANLFCFSAARRLENDPL